MFEITTRVLYAVSSQPCFKPFSGLCISNIVSVERQLKWRLSTLSNIYQSGERQKYIKVLACHKLFVLSHFFRATKVFVAY